MQNLHIEYELKVWQKERVPSRFDTRLWLYRLHGRVRFASGERNIKFLRLCRQNHSESTDYELNMRPPYCNRTTPKALLTAVDRLPLAVTSPQTHVAKFPIAAGSGNFVQHGRGEFRGRINLFMHLDRKSTRLNSSHLRTSRMPSSA